MKVKELKKLLENCNDEDMVVLSLDGEGNSYSPLDGIEERIYVPETTYLGSTYIKELTDELIKLGFSDEDLYHGKYGFDAIVLYPVN